MKIRRMSATFGKLKNSSLDLTDGLNVVSAPNEYGKSTWCAFIKAMLYGIDTSDRNKAGYLADKVRYRPWDGGAMAGTMELEHGGAELTIMRKSLGSVPMKSFLAARTGTADFIADITADNAGEYFTGVSQSVFERTAFITRPSLKISQTPELEKRISMLVSSGDSGTSYTDIYDTLHKKILRLRHNKTGLLPALEAELSAARAKRDALEAKSEDIARLRDLTARYDRQASQLEEDLAAHDRLDARSEARRLAEARAKSKTAENAAEEIRQRLTRNGKLITREDVNSARSAIAAIEPLRDVRDKAKTASWAAEKEVENAHSRVRLSPLGTMSADEASSLAAHLAELESGKAERKKPLIPIWASVLILLAGIIAAAASFIGPLWSALNIPSPDTPAAICRIAGGVLILAGIAFIFIRRPAATGIEELHTTLAKYKIGSAGQFREVADRYCALCMEADTAEAALAGAKLSYENAEKAAAEAEAVARAKVADIMPGVTSGEEMAAELVNIEKLLDRLTQAEFDAIAAKNVYETLLASFHGDPDVPDEYIPVPIRNRADTLTALEKVKLQKAEAERSYNVALGEQRALGDPAVIEGEINAITEKIAAMERRYAALSLAIETMADANTEMQTRFSPLISRRAGEIMSALTAGRYEKLVFDKSFSAEAKTADDVVSRDAISLSDGTADEVYFALRLAMCELMLSGNEPCPIILDDALANFDDGRCRAALDFLLKEAESRQVILFTCHDRECEMLRGTAANIVKA